MFGKVKGISKNKIGFAFLIVLCIFFIAQKIVEYQENKPKIVNELGDIKLDEKISDVLFKNEGFTIAQEPENEYGVLYSNINAKKHFYAKNGLITRIALSCEKEDRYTEYGKIKCNQTSEEILQKYKEEVKVFCRYKDDEMKTKNRIYDVEKYGIRFGLEYNKVIGFLITKPQ
jgi:hypothetical protein